MNLNYITQSDAAEAVEAVRADEAPPADVADPSKVTDAGKAPQVTADDLYSKLLKFIPAPLVGIYLMAANLFIGLPDEGKEPSSALLLGTLVFFLIATIAYLVVRKVRLGQIAISSLAFVVFAAGSPGWFQYLDWWQPEFATVALIVVAVLIIVFRPKSDLPKE